MTQQVSHVKPTYNSDNLSLTAEGGINFFRYLKKFNLAGDTDLLILSPNNHFYYDENELKGVRTLINLKKLNFIDDLDTFFHTLSCILPSNANIIGCFDGNKSIVWDGFVSGLISRFNNMVDSKTNYNLDKKDVSILLNKAGFSLVDMSDMNGITYFYSQNVRHPVRITM
jgi:hypothetical protein